MLGLALILLGAAVALSKRHPKTLGFLMGLTGLAYLAQGWVLGSDGFSAGNTTAILAGYVLMLAWTVWLAVLAWRRNGLGSDAMALTDAGHPSPVIP
jgi:hypothetical protein